jgi:hypothetical protein
MGDVRLAAEILRTSSEDIPREITELDRAIDLRDARAASLIAHRIKGAALNMACARIAARANEVGGSATFTDGKKLAGARAIARRVRGSGGPTQGGTSSHGGASMNNDHSRVAELEAALASEREARIALERRLESLVADESSSSTRCITASRTT